MRNWKIIERLGLILRRSSLEIMERFFFFYIGDKFVAYFLTITCDYFNLHGLDTHQIK